MCARCMPLDSLGELCIAGDFFYCKLTNVDIHMYMYVVHISSVRMGECVLSHNFIKNELSFNLIRSIMVRFNCTGVCSN